MLPPAAQNTFSPPAKLIPYALRNEPHSENIGKLFRKPTKGDGMMN